MTWDYELDVVVVGGGGCGLMAALRAGMEGKREVVIFERNSRLLSNTAISSGTLAAGGTRFQRSASVADSPDQHASDVLKKNGRVSDPVITRALCAAAPQYVEWLADALGYPVVLADDMPRVGHSVSRLHVDEGRQGGAEVMRYMREGIAASDIYVVDNTPVVGLIPRARSVQGVIVRENHELRRVRAEAVVLACGGFGANREMVRRFCPEMAGAEYIGVDGSQGDGIRWGLGMGAGTDHMGSYQGHGHVIVGYGTRVNPGVPLLGGLVVNRDGRRFTREDQGYSEFAAEVLGQPGGEAIEIWDQRILEQVENSELMRVSKAARAYKAFDSWSSLARAFKLREDVLLAELEAYEDGLAAGRDPLGRELLGQPLNPPLYAARITGGLAHTQGGLRVDVLGRVQAQDGAWIENLYAGGGVAAGLSGDGGRGYLSGNGLLSALGFGYIIGTWLAGNADRSARLVT